MGWIEPVRDIELHGAADDVGGRFWAVVREKGSDKFYETFSSVELFNPIA